MPNSTRPFQRGDVVTRGDWCGDTATIERIQEAEGMCEQTAFFQEGGFWRTSQLTLVVAAQPNAVYDLASEAGETATAFLRAESPASKRMLAIKAMDLWRQILETLPEVKP